MAPRCRIQEAIPAGFSCAVLVPRARRLQKAVASGDVNQIARVNSKIQVDHSSMPDALNGNSVKLEDELVNLQRNTMTHSFALQVLGRSLNKIKSAITGRVGH